jgi:uncharacterized protein Yka (UPF0111/DUF47 family)
LLAKSVTERSEGDVGKLEATHAELQRKETEADEKYREVLGQMADKGLLVPVSSHQHRLSLLCNDLLYPLIT